MSKHEAPYTFFHLNLDELNTTDEGKAQIKALVSTHPRVDPTLSKAFPSEIYSKLPLKPEDREVVLNKLVEEYAQVRKLRVHKTAAELLSSGLYVEMAKVNAANASLARHKTISINNFWWDKADKEVEVTGSPSRSTDAFDMVRRFDEFFLVLPLGYMDMATGEYCNEMV